MLSHHSKNQVSNFMNKGKTLCGFGPMSKLFVHALMQVAEETDDPIQIVCSRNQIESESLMVDM